MKVLFVFGTRPEAIKLAPLIRQMQARPESFDVRVCVTAQHRHMLDQVLDFFRISPHYDLDLMRSNQTLFDVTTSALDKLRHVYEDSLPELVVVQGDTTSAFGAALAAYYCRTTIAHVEAGLRSSNKYSPFPEEMNRKLTSHLADYHFAPTEIARANLAAEGIHENVFVVGNTVIDALLLGLRLIDSHGSNGFVEKLGCLDFSKRLILVTAHRRESFGRPFEQIVEALNDIGRRFADVQLVYPAHLNPNVQEPLRRVLCKRANVHVIPPLDYPQFIWLMNRAYIVLTDSGGVQEEAPSLGKPVLVMRDVTERAEGISAGTAKLVGTSRDRIVAEVTELLTNGNSYRTMANAVNPYGDGTASQQIVRILQRFDES